MPENDEAPAAANPGAPSDDQTDRPVTSKEASTPDGAPTRYGADFPFSPDMQLEDIDPSKLSDEEDARRDERRTAAIQYASQRGWQVIPVWHVLPDGTCACPREQCFSPGKHAILDEWQKKATNDWQAVAEWWRPHPDELLISNWFPRANVGIVTGPGSGIWVLDVDTYAGGEQTLGGYERRHGELPRTRQHSTASGGQHLIWRHPGWQVRNSARKRFGEGIDVRGDNGLIVVPPSIGVKGSYSVPNPAHDIDPVDAPDWMLNLLREENARSEGRPVPGGAPSAGSPRRRAYAEAALKSEADRMRRAEPGERNNTLNECAFQLGTLGGAELLDEETAWNALSEAASAAGLSMGEARPTFLSGWRAGMLSPRDVPWGSVHGGDTPRRARDQFGLSDRMVDHFAESFRWCPQRRTWMSYRTGVWAPESQDAGYWKAHEMIEHLMLTEGEAYSDEREEDGEGGEHSSERDRFEDWVNKQRTVSARNAAADLCRDNQAMRISQETFDIEPLLLNHLGGVVSLRDSAMLPHDPELRMTLQCPVTCDLDAPAPHWNAFLRRVQPKEDMRTALQILMGYSVTALTGEQVMIIHHGEGANGKSVFHSVIAKVLGTYAQTVPVETLMASKVEGRVPNDVARMAGRRVLFASETKAGKFLDEQMIKQLTGGDLVAARFMRAEFFEFRPVGKIHLTTNHLLRVSDDPAIWRRLILIPWDEFIPPEERDPFLADTLFEQEGPAILAWLVRGAQMYLAREGSRRLVIPTLAQQKLEQYRREEDLGATIEEYFDILSPQAEKLGVGQTTTELYLHYRFRASQEGLSPMSQKAFVQLMKKKGHKHHSLGNKQRGFLDLRVPVDMPAIGAS